MDKQGSQLDTLTSDNARDRIQQADTVNNDAGG